MRRYLSTTIKKRQYALLFGDILVLILSIFFSYVIKIYLKQKIPSIAVIFPKLNPWLSIVVLTHLFSLYLLDQYNLGRLASPVRSTVMVVLSVWLGGLIISGVFFFFPKYIFGRQVLIIHLLLVSITMSLWRWVAIEAFIKKLRSRALAVVGDGQTVSSFIEELSRMRNTGFTIKSVCILQNGSSVSPSETMSFSNYSTVADLLATDNFDALALDSANGLYSNEEVRLILELRHRGKAVYDLPTLYKNLTGKVPVRYIDGRWLLNSDELQGEVNVSYAKVKRVIDVALSSLLFILLSPLFVLIAIAIKLDSRGSIFFAQERLGVYRRPFRCFKFRSMVEDAEGRSGPVWSSENDARITRVGRLLRKSRLDELPQLWNVLKGDMSFVGPRPIREHFANELGESIPFYGLRFAVKPGLSGWAQVNYDYAGSREGQLEKFQYELFYIQNMSFFLDLLTIVKTVHRVFRGGGGT